MVSISCITYNHEEYIVDALESFHAKIIKYVLIHDDASQIDCLNHQRL